MQQVLLAFLVVAQLPISPEAPRDVLSPQECMQQFLAQFSNFDLDGTQTFSDVPAVGDRYQERSDVKCRVTADMMVVQSRAEIKAMSDRQGNSMRASTQYRENRWFADRVGLRTELEEMWPMVASKPESVPVHSIVIEPKRDGDLNIAWGNVVLRLFAPTNQPSVVTMLEMVTEGGRCDYTLKHVTWASEDRSTRISYQFVSNDFGTTTTTFSKVGDRWIPTTIRIQKSANDKVYFRNSPGSDRVGNAIRTSDFSEQTNGLDRLEVTYEIAYSETPLSIQREEVRFHKKEKAVVTTLLTINHFRSGNVTNDEVRQMMLPLPDNQRHVHHADPELEKLAWTTKDGTVVKQIDSLGVELGNGAKFKSRPWSRWFVVMNVVSLLAVVGIFSSRWLARGK